MCCSKFYYILIAYVCLSIVADLNFGDSEYSTEESNGLVQFTLLLSIPSSFNIHVQVLSVNALATGKCIHDRSFLL